MKSMGVIVFAVVAFATFTGVICNPVDTEIEPNCDSYFAMPGMGYACKRDYKPVCGTDGRTYSNECELCSDNMKLKMEIKIKYRRSCLYMDEKQDECEKFRSPVCTLEYNPVCGSDAVSYGNKCMFCSVKQKKADLRIVSLGECPKNK
ncbi:double-headed protease inhibitor, submandibular gland-like isoform 2-T2 [Leptodactylus fuscus]|uniref:double-headed protease inhibitor, submandibular gland-like isoform X2 n=1 Tax=Leptodactylus fuscus TaxID=238119 RepID=UPI003F4E47B0